MSNHAQMKWDASQGKWTQIGPDHPYGVPYESYCQKLWMEPSGGDLILPDSVNEFHIFDDLSQPAVAL